MVRSFAELEERLRASWSAETASTWTSQNPARGQCSVTALVVHDLRGGDILKTKVGPHWHFYNSVDGERVDLTSAQFEEEISYEDVPATRDEALSDTTPEQYQALRTALATRLERHGGSPSTIADTGGDWSSPKAIPLTELTTTLCTGGRSDK